MKYRVIVKFNPSDLKFKKLYLLIAFKRKERERGGKKKRSIDIFEISNRNISRPKNEEDSFIRYSFNEARRDDIAHSAFEPGCVFGQ